MEEASESDLINGLSDVCKILTKFSIMDRWRILKAALKLIGKE